MYLKNLACLVVETMKYLFELSKEHGYIPKAEVFSCLKAENISYKMLDSNNDILLLDLKIKPEQLSKISSRLAMSFFIDTFLFSSPLCFDRIYNLANKNVIKKDGSIAIKYTNRSKSADSQEILKILAEAYTRNRKVDLENPDIEVRFLISDEKVYVGCKQVEIDRSQFERRKVQYRPFFSPISLHPRLARALVNLSCVSRDGVLLDPFCGTGGILLEAGLIGVKVVGSDIEDKMIDGCEKTLSFYKVKDFELFTCDIGDINRYVSVVDAVVTDFPYGKSTTTKGESVFDLSSRAFDSISSILKKKSRAVVGLPNSDLVSVGENYLTLVDIFEFRVHRSLTRFFAIFEK